MGNTTSNIDEGSVMDSGCSNREDKHTFSGCCRTCRELLDKKGRWSNYRSSRNRPSKDATPNTKEEISQSFSPLDCSYTLLDEGTDVEAIFLMVEAMKRYRDDSELVREFVNYQLGKTTQKPELFR